MKILHLLSQANFAGVEIYEFNSNILVLKKQQR